MRDELAPVETAGGLGGVTERRFPREWGPAPGAPMSDERAQWVRSNVARLRPDLEVRALVDR